MKTSQRIDIIRKIGRALQEREITESNFILRNFGSRTWTEHEDGPFEYYLGRTEELDEDRILELFEYLFPGEMLPSGVTLSGSSLWKDGFVKAFISHSHKQKLLATQIKAEAAEYGIDCFVAHEDIKASKEWMREIRYGLATCDCIVPLLTKDFKSSEFCDQEVGFALQRSILIIPVTIEKNPYGFMAPFQRVTAYQKTPTEIAKEIQSLIFNHDTLAKVAQQGVVASQRELVKAFLNSSNFSDSSALLKKIEGLLFIPIPLLKSIDSQWEKNDQVAGCNGIPKRIDRLFYKHKFKAT